MGWWPFGRRSRQTGATARTLAVRAKPACQLSGRFDSAQTTPDNRRHWANADGLSADAAASPEVRRTLRNRARYEVANNSYARGIVLTLANDVIGTGPRLQMLTDGDETNQSIEREFATWAKAVDLPGKLRTMRQARAQDGEAFAVLFSNDSLDSPIKLDLKLIEAEQVATPSAKRSLDSGAVDGIVFDVFGNSREYHVLKAHPGGGGAATGSQDHDTIPAAGMIHWFRTDRPGQRRGLPDILPALPLFAQLRRYTLATVSAAVRCTDPGRVP
jgi:capsid protein